MQTVGGSGNPLPTMGCLGKQVEAQFPKPSSPFIQTHCIFSPKSKILGKEITLVTPGTNKFQPHEPKGQSTYEGHAQREPEFSRLQISNTLDFNQIVDSSNSPMTASHPPIRGSGWQWLNIPSDQGPPHRMYTLAKVAVLKGQSVHGLSPPLPPQSVWAHQPNLPTVRDNKMRIPLNNFSESSCCVWGFGTLIGLPPRKGEGSSLRCVLWVFMIIVIHFVHCYIYFKIPFKRLGSIIFKFNFKRLNLRTFKKKLMQQSQKHLPHWVHLGFFSSVLSSLLLL